MDQNAWFVGMFCAPTLFVLGLPFLIAGLLQGKKNRFWLRLGLLFLFVAVVLFCLAAAVTLNAHP